MFMYSSRQIYIYANYPTPTASLTQRSAGQTAEVNVLNEPRTYDQKPRCPILRSAQTAENLSCPVHDCTRVWPNPKMEITVAATWAIWQPKTGVFSCVPVL